MGIVRDLIDWRNTRIFRENLVLSPPVCRLFHPVTKEKSNLFRDMVDGKGVNQYRCHCCNVTFWAVSSKDWFRAIN